MRLYVGIQSAIANLYKKIFGTRNDRLLKKLSAFADAVEEFEPKVKELSPEDLKAKT